MVEEGDKRVSTNVLELARKLNIDPELAQEVYFASNLSEAVDGLDKNYLGSELEKFRSLKRVLAKQQTKFEHQDVIQITFRKTGFDLKKELINLQKRVDEMIKFSEERLRIETSGTRANKKAHEIAKYVANLFDSVGRNVGFGVQPLDADEPSTPFGRAVRDALSIFKVYNTPSSDFENPRIVHWKWPAKAAAEEHRNTKTPKK